MVILRRTCWIALLGLTIACAEERSGISVSASLAPPLHPCLLTVTILESGRSREARGCDFATDVNWGTPHSPEWGTSTSGDLTVSFVLADTAGAWQVTGQATLPLRPDWRWGVQFANTTQNPAAQCFGCAGSLAFPLPPAARAAGRDSLWIVWGGNSIAHPVVY
jgi:hypothetical protein